MFYGQEMQLGYLFAEKEVNLVEKETLSAPISPNKKKRLYHRLEIVSGLIEVLRDAGKNPSSLETKMVSLHGKIHSLSIDYEVKLLKESSLKLSAAVLANDQDGATPHINHLKKQLTRLQMTHSLSADNQLLVNEASKALYQAYTTFYGEESSARELAKMEEKLRAKKEMRQEEEIDLDAISYLFEIAALVYQGNIKAAEKQFHTLPSEQQSQTRKHLAILQDGDSRPFSDTRATIQALVATAGDLTSHDRQGNYLTLEQIDQMFEDIKEISKEE